MAKPYLVSDPYSVVRGPWLGKWLVVGDTFDGVRAVGRQVHMDGVTMGVVERVIPASNLSAYAPLEISSLQSVISGLKEEMLTHGASRLAVQWVGELSPFSKKELSIMADKLKTKQAAPKAAKAPAKKAGNTAALEKAREARAEASRADRAYKHEVKPKEAIESTRENSWTRRMVEIIMGHKSTNDAKAELAADKEFSEKRLDFGWAASKGFIKFA